MKSSVPQPLHSPTPAPADSPRFFALAAQTHGEVGQPDAQLVISVASPQRSGGKANRQGSPADAAAEGGQAEALRIEEEGTPEERAYMQWIQQVCE